MSGKGLDLNARAICLRDDGDITVGEDAVDVEDKDFDLAGAGLCVFERCHLKMIQGAVCGHEKAAKEVGSLRSFWGGLVEFDLPPIALVPDVAAALFAPVAGNPDCSRMRRPAIGAGNPDVGMPIPTVVTLNPDITGMRSSGYNLNRARRRRADADDDLSVGSADRKKESGYGDEESARCFHENLLLLA